MLGPGALPAPPEPHAALPRRAASEAPALPLPRLFEDAPRGEQELYSQRATLYRFHDNKWQVQRVGNAKLLSLTGKVRFMLQEEGTMKILSKLRAAI